jgi:hypothetical protein
MPTAFWAIYWAAKTPEVLARCVVEANEALAAIEGGDPISTVLTRMPEIDAVVSEVGVGGWVGPWWGTEVDSIE